MYKPNNRDAHCSQAVDNTVCVEVIIVEMNQIRLDLINPMEDQAYDLGIDPDPPIPFTYEIRSCCSPPFFHQFSDIESMKFNTRISGFVHEVFKKTLGTSDDGSIIVDDEDLHIVSISK